MHQRQGPRTARILIDHLRISNTNRSLCDARASDEYIEALIHHKLGESERSWKIAQEAKDGLRMLEYKCNKELVLKDNINIRYKGYR